MLDGFWIVYAIFWWVIAACCTVSVILYVFVCLEYWRWDREEREREKLREITVDNDNSSE